MPHTDKLASEITFDLGAIYYRLDNEDPRGDKFYIFYGTISGKYNMIYTNKIHGALPIDPSNKNPPGGNFGTVYQDCVDSPIANLGIWNSDNITENLTGVFYEFDEGAVFLINKKGSRPPIVFVLYDSVRSTTTINDDKCPGDKNPVEKGGFNRYILPSS